MWKHQFQSDKPVSVIRYPKVHNGDIHYIDDSRNLMVLDGFTFNLKYQSDIEEKAHIQQIVDGQLFLIAKKERGEMIYRFDNGMLSAQFDSEMEDCWVLPDNRLFCSTDVALSTGPKSSSIIRYFDLETGQSLWEFDPSLVLGYKEKSEEGVFYGGKENNKLYRLNPDTGETLWHIDLPEGVKTANEPIRVYDSVLSVSLEKKIKQRGRRDRRLRFMWGLNPDTGERLWEISHRSLFFFKEPKTGLLHNFSSASKAFGEKEYFYECIDPVAGKLLSQKEVPGEYKGLEVGTVSPHLKTLDNGILYFKADNRVIGRFNINSQCVEYAQVLKELTSQRFSEPQIYGNRMLVSDDNERFHVYEWVE